MQQGIMCPLLKLFKLLTIQFYIIQIQIDLIGFHSPIQILKNCDASITIAHLIIHVAYYCQTQSNNSRCVLIKTAYQTADICIANVSCIN
jgi:dihydroorotate dehydrogenase